MNAFHINHAFNTHKLYFNFEMFEFNSKTFDKKMKE